MNTSYSELLKHPKWQKKRLQILERDDFKCRICNDQETTLHVHHLKYIYNHKPWEYANEDLLTLCKDCHTVIEMFKFGKQSYQIKEFFGIKKNNMLFLCGREIMWIVDLDDMRGFIQLNEEEVKCVAELIKKL